MWNSRAALFFTPCAAWWVLMGTTAHAQAVPQPVSSAASVVPDTQPGWLSRFIGDNGFTSELQIGMDAWDLHPSEATDTAANQNGNKRLFFANSGTMWPYQDAAPWVRFRGVLRPLPDTQITLKYRADQALGSQVDEFSLDQTYYGVGARIGVLDYKTTWCRTYDVDSPWVRENDPFCTTESSSRSVSAAPGVQAYTNFVLGNFKWQAVAGAYSPLQLNYDAKEFTNLVLNDFSTVTKNDKVGASINATNLESGLEIRLSFLHTDQSANYRSSLKQPTYRIDQQVDVVYAGISFNPTPLLNVRLTQMQSNLQGTSSYPAGYALPDDTTAPVFSRDSSPKTSSVLELNYQTSARDVHSLAYSVYELGADSTRYTVSLPSMSISTTELPGQFFNRSTNTSLSWRRDWAKGVFSVLQLSMAQVQSATNLVKGAPPREVSSNGYAIGLRLGYRF